MALRRAISTGLGDVDPAAQPIDVDRAAARPSATSMRPPLEVPSIKSEYRRQCLARWRYPRNS
jgi:hypothetical protein